MPPLVCPRCRSTNPEAASFCYHDGEALRGGQQGAAQGPGGQLPREFVFPSGHRCRTFDELAHGCQEEWAGARELLQRGHFQQFFSSCGRADLARAAAEAMRQPDPNLGLTNLLGSLPVARAAGARLDIQPRRIHLANVGAGEARQIEVTVSNQGQGALRGTLTVTEGAEWLRLGAGTNGQCEVNTTGAQKVQLQVDTRGLPAAQSYGAKLTIATNGGVVELPVRLDLAAHPFPRAPFQGARAPRELAEKMRTQPKAAVALLESGEVARWFSANGWNYPVRGTPARGVAGVQQFFESMGLARPPALQLSQTEVGCTCPTADPARLQVLLFSQSKKWVYANVESDAPWLRILTPQVAGAQQTAIGFEVDPRQLPRGGRAEGTLRLSANGGQNLVVRVRAQATGRVASGGGLLRAVLTGALACLLLRLLLAPLADGYAREAATGGGGDYAAWLERPWPAILLGAEATHDFRDHFVSLFVRIVTLGTWWVGALGGALLLARRGIGNLPWGLVAGAVAGAAGGATVACLLLVGDLLPHTLWATLGLGGGAGLLAVWIPLAVLCWAALGAGLGVILGLTGALGRAVLAPTQAAVAGFLRLVGMRGAAEYFAPAARRYTAPVG